MKKALLLSGAAGGDGVPVRNGLVAEYKFDECRNLLKYSQQFDNAAWTKAKATVTANAAVAPDGTTTADKLVEDTTVNVLHTIQGNFATTGITQTLSVYVKSAGRNAILQLGSGDQGVAWDIFDFTTGNFVTPGTLLRSVSVGDGWYRLSLSKVPGSAYIAVLTANGVNSTYTGDGASGIYVWGAQLEAGSSATTYVPTTSKQTIADYSGKGNTVTVGSALGDTTNDPLWTGNGQYFTTDDYDFTADAASLQVSQYTLCIVWNPNAADTADVLLAKNTAAVTGAGNKGFILTQTATGTGDLTLSQFDSDVGGTLHTVSSATTPAASTWHFSAAACDGTTLYLSPGQAAAYTAGATTLTAAAANVVQALHLGRYAHDASGYYAGSIAYIAIYNRKLVQSELTKNYQYLKSYLLKNRGISLA